ncbi:MAG: DUF5671 domain-containing protein [Candidatus Andersenbacteria bacterium]
MPERTTQQRSTHPHTTAGDLFAYLLLFLMLYVAVFAVLALLFDYVDAAYPQSVFSYYGGGVVGNSMITSISTLIVVWPVYISMAWLTGKWLNRDRSRRNLAIRKWLVYLTLFASAVTLIIDLVVLVYNFLSGGLSVSFGLKVLAVLVVAGAVFGYYLWDLRRTGAQTLLPRVLAITISVLLAGAIVGGFFLIGTPREQRDQRFDERRISDLQSIQSEIISFYSSKKTLPDTLAELETDVTGFVVPTDPDAAAQYEYTPTGELTFDLCATFATKQDYSAQSTRGRPELIYPPFGLYNDNWSHQVGRVCFSRTIDPELLQPVPAVK